MHLPRRRIHLVATLLLLGSVLPAGCGGEDSTGPGDDTDPGDDPTVALVAVTPPAPSLEVGETVQLSASATDAGGAPVSASFTWGSDDPSVATVSSSGLVTAVGEGATAVTAEADGVTGAAAVEVIDPGAGLEATMDGVEQVLEELMPPPSTPFVERDLVGELRTVAEVLVQREDIMTTRVDPSSQTLQVDRIDGTSIVVANSRPPRPEEAAPGPVPTIPAGVLAPRTASPPARVGPPASAEAVWISIDGGASVGAEVGGLLSQAGYDVRNPPGSLDDMRQLQGLGALYLDTHGVVWTPVLEVTTDEDGNAVDKVDGEPLFALQTTTTVDVARFAELQEELENGEVVVSYAQNATTGRWEATLAITERFIARHWSFDDAVVMIHACNGGRGPVAGGWDCFGLCDPDDPYDPTPLRQAVLAAGADVVVAFDNITWPTNARPSILYLFDRLLGTNEHDPEVVPNRPVDIGQVMGGMQRKNLLSFQLGSADVNVVFDVADNRVTLAPSIRRMEIADDVASGQGELTLHGTFGGDPGEVEIGGQAAPVEIWTDDRVVARAPYEGAGSLGDVVAIKPDGVESNGAPLTEWRSTLTVTLDPGRGSLQAEAEVDVVFRADVHPFRERVDGDTREEAVRTWTSPASEGEVRGSGSYTEGGTTLSFFGSDPIELLTRAEVDAGGGRPGGSRSVFGGFVDLDPGARQAQLCLSILGQVNVRVESEGGTFDEKSELLVLPLELFDGVVDGLPCLFLPFGLDYTIPSGSTSFRADPVEWRLEWTTFQPEEAPDEQTAG